MPLRDNDPTLGSFGTTVEGGTVFRVVRYEPGVVPRDHRTDSIDYAVIISGEIDMEATARHHPQLAQPRHRGLRHCFRSDQCQARDRRRQAAQRSGLIRAISWARCPRPSRLRRPA